MRIVSARLLAATFVITQAMADVGPGRCIALRILRLAQAPASMVSLGSEYYTIRDDLRSGVPASIVLLLLTWAAALVYWPLLGYRP